MFQKATKTQAKLRCAIVGTSGSGKTYSSLAIASGLGKKIAVIDTERGSASKYANLFDFDVAELQQSTIEEYITEIKNAEKNKYDVLIIDSMSHAWESLLEQMDQLTKTKYRGNSFGAWSEGTPEQKKFINAILRFDGHIICTMRSKTEWIIEQNEKGRSAPRKIGLAPEQRKNIEYEFDFVLEISQEHLGIITKDRTGKFQDKIIEKPNKKLGEELKEWLNEGENLQERIKKHILNCTTYEQLTLLYTTYKDHINNDLLDLLKKRKTEIQPDLQINQQTGETIQ